MNELQMLGDKWEADLINEIRRRRDECAENSISVSQNSCYRKQLERIVAMYDRMLLAATQQKADFMNEQAFLLPCTCGCTDVCLDQYASNGWLVTCVDDNCGAIVYETTQQLVISKWNSRADLSQNESVVPIGWKLVPNQPTDEMINAAWDSEGAVDVGERKSIYNVHFAYFAMLAAVPNPPSETQS